MKPVILAKNIVYQNPSSFFCRNSTLVIIQKSIIIIHLINKGKNITIILIYMGKYSKQVNKNS